MKTAKRLISGVLSLLTACSLCLTALPAARAEGAAGAAALTGSIGLTLRFDLPQSAQSAAGRDIRLRLTGGGQDLTVPLPAGTAAVPVEVDNQDGAPLGGEEYVGYYKVTLTGLPAGQEYQLTLTGTGYRTFRTGVTLDGFSRHLIVGTGDGTFSLGDVDGDGEITAADLNAMDTRLGRSDRAFDLNGDGRVDIADLAYISHNLGVSGAARVLDTAAILAPAVDTAALTVTGGSAADLFRDGGEVTLTPAPGADALSLPIDLGAQAVEVNRIEITCPDGAGAIQKGQALVELGNGTTQTVPFDTTPPEGVHAAGRSAGERVVTIDLGKRVPVKKVTITVRATQDGAGFAVVRKIEFLKDIVPDNPKSEQLRILSAVPGDRQVTLTWTAMRNVTGYTVHYGTGGKLDRQLPAGSTGLTVTGLENLTAYQFQVTAVNGTWSSAPSPTVSATPQPGSAPGAPSNIAVAAADRSLRLSWGKTKDAEYYQVFFRAAGSASFTQFGGNVSGTSATITGLTNDTAYEVAVRAGNARGLGPYSAVAAGTPKLEGLILPELPEEGRLDSSVVESVVMENPRNVNRSLCPSFKVEDVIDNDAATYWVANQWWVSSRFTYTFRQPQDMNYAILVPYLGGNHKYALKTYTVTAKNSAGQTILEQTLYSARALDPAKNYIVLTFPLLEDVKELSLTLNEREGNGCRVSISEMAFYKSDTLAEDIADLFADGAFTALKGGVSAQRIAELSARLEAKADFYLDLARLRDELELARALLDGDRSALGAVKADVQSRGGELDRACGQSASDLQPLGVSARAGATVAVYAQLPGDKPVYVVPTQFFGESGIWRGTPVQLVNGRNYITVPKIGSLTDERGGPLYLAYAGAHPEQIRLQVRLDKNSFHIPVLELSGWYDMGEGQRREAIRAYVAELQTYVGALGSRNLQVDVRNATEISTPSVLLSIPASQALAGLTGKTDMVQALYDNVLAWEDELFVANQVQGIVPSGLAMADYRYPMTTRQNIRYMRMFAGAFMYAAGSHIGVGYGSTTGLMCGRPVSVTGAGRTNGLFGWGIAHEIGHNMDKLGRAEITNNIYALAIQAYDGSTMALDTRLTNSNIWQGVWDKTSAGRPGSAGSVFVQLGMYWQLHLAYDGADRPLDFYNRFFSAWKSGRYRDGFTYDERVALIAAETAGRDLTEFFTRWGMTLGEETRSILAGLPGENRAVWYLNDASYAARLHAGTGSAMPAVRVSAAVAENKVTLTVAGGNADILGYEIRRDGRPIAFTAGSVYTDDLGPANNLTYSYSVVPVDRLGNMGVAVTVGEVRVAYDKTIDSGWYALTQSGGAAVFTMKGGKVSVTGLKASAGDLSACTVSVRLEEDGPWTPVKLGPAAGGTAYFTKPGAQQGDTRLWTYDVTAVRVEGLPQDARLDLLDYPGDRVDFYPGAVAGRLTHDYTYTDAEGAVHTIRAGTPVIVGTYRGDPVYGYVEIQGRYDITGEAQDHEPGGAASRERPMNGDSLLFAEIPADGAVSDISDGFWLFVPDLAAEAQLTQAMETQSGAGDIAQGAAVRQGPTEIRAVLRRTDLPDSDQQERDTSRTLWVSFPDYDSLPQITLTADGAAQ